MESLTAALNGVDALVSTVGAVAIEAQTVLIDAAIAASVKRFIPSEFGSVTTNPKLETFPLYAPMSKVRHYLQDKASSGRLTWTVLACGSFLEFILGDSGLLDFVNHKAILLDGGNNRISSTSLPKVGQALAGILKNSEFTKNRIVRISEVILTQNGLLKIAQQLRPNIKWEISEGQTSVMLKEGLDEFNGGNFSLPVIWQIVKGTALAGDTYGSAYDETDNELLGVQELNNENLEKLVAAKVA